MYKISSNDVFETFLESFHVKFKLWATKVTIIVFTAVSLNEVAHRLSQVYFNNENVKSM